MIEAYFTLKIVVSVLLAAVVVAVLVGCLIKKVVEVIASACKKPRKRGKGR